VKSDNRDPTRISAATISIPENSKHYPSFPQEVHFVSVPIVPDLHAAVTGENQGGDSPQRSQRTLRERRKTGKEENSTQRPKATKVRWGMRFSLAKAQRTPRKENTHKNRKFLSISASLFLSSLNLAFALTSTFLPEWAFCVTSGAVVRMAG
jgi:hypothetical protein